MRKIAMFIDGPNVSASVHALNFYIDYSKLKAVMGNKLRGNVVLAKYYTAILEDDNGHQPLRQILDFLDYNGYQLVTKEAKVYKTTGQANKVKGNMDVDITVDMMKLCSFVDEMVLFSGDGDFSAAVLAVQERGIPVTVVSQAAYLSRDLRRSCQRYIDWAELKDQVRSKRI